jgi:lysophospholipase L1-like esterase
VTHVIVHEGINDIGFWNVTPEALIAGYRRLIDQAHRRGLAISFGTLCPFEGATYYSEQGEATRKAVNRWIRESDEFDGMIDFDRALRDPSAPRRLLPSYDSGDSIHPSDAGYEAMAAAVDLVL